MSHILILVNKKYSSYTWTPETWIPETWAPGDLDPGDRGSRARAHASPSDEGIVRSVIIE